jgi:hypothetical protein
LTSAPFGVATSGLIDASYEAYDRCVANTSYLRRAVEGYVRARLAEEFDQPFAAEFLGLRPGGRHEFDAVSSDRNVVVSVKSASGRTSGGRIPSGKIKDSIAELYYLSLVEARIRRLVLTTPEFFEIFVKTTCGAVAEGIEVVCMPLPPAIQEQVDLIVREASREVTPVAASAAIAAEIETNLDTGSDGQPK